MSKRSNPGDKKKLVESFEWTIPIEWFDLTGYHRIEDPAHLESGRRAKIQLVTSGTQDHYTRFLVQIVDINSGVIDSNYFRVNDYLVEHDCGRYEQKNLNGLEIIGYCGWHWHCRGPKTTKPICEAIEGWIDQFRVRVRGESGELELAGKPC